MISAYFILMKVAISVTPLATARWISLTLKGIPGVEPVLISGMDPSAPPPDLLVVDGDQPGPEFYAYIKSHTIHHGHCPAVILGSPTSAVSKTLGWESLDVVFIPKPHTLEDVRHAVAKKLSSLRPQEGQPTRQNNPSTANQKLGYLSTLHLSEILRMLCLNQWTGKIEVTQLTSRVQGDVYLNEGILIHAKTPGQSGEPACCEMLKWGRCDFILIEQYEPVVTSIKNHWEWLLLEAARQMDEAAHF